MIDEFVELEVVVGAAPRAHAVILRVGDLGVAPALLSLRMESRQFRQAQPLQYSAELLESHTQRQQAGFQPKIQYPQAGRQLHLELWQPNL